MESVTKNDQNRPKGKRPSNWGYIVAAFTLFITGFILLSTVLSRPIVREMMDAGEGSVAVEAAPHYMPLVFGSAPDPTPQPTTPVTIGPPLPPPTEVVAIPPIDFDAAREDARSKGLDIAFVKIGFHTGPGGNSDGLKEYLHKLNDAGVPFFIKSVDGTSGIFDGQQIMKDNEALGREIDHTLVYRRTDKAYEDPYYNYAIDPETAASISWQLNRDAMPKELEKEYIWLETLNEPGRIGNDGNLQIERLGRFSLATAKLAVAEGYKYAAFAFSRGVPGTGDWLDPEVIETPNDWEHPAMLDFLRYAGEHPDQVAVALHEYSGTVDHIDFGYPFLVGRLQALLNTVDQHGIKRPTILITEWGWTHNDVPDPIPAREDIAWASWLYAAYPTVKGAAIWYLGPQFEGIANQAQQLIEPLGDFAVSHYYIIDPGIGQIDPNLFQPNPPTLLGLEWQDMVTPYPRLRAPQQ